MTSGQKFIRLICAKQSLSSKSIDFSYSVKKITLTFQVTQINYTLFSIQMFYHSLLIIVLQVICAKVELLII